MTIYHRRDYDHLRTIADGFLVEHHPPPADIPIPIENIVEFNLGLDIVPIPGLQEEFEVDGFLALGRHAIQVDEWVMMRRPGRYRFTLAYETGRFLLQTELCSTAVKTVADFLEWHRDLPSAVHADSKHEAYDFGGLVLVPSHFLKREFEKARATVDRAMHNNYWHLKSFLWLGIIDDLAKRFDVSSQVIKRRVIRDGLLPKGVQI